MKKTKCLVWNIEWELGGSSYQPIFDSILLDEEFENDNDTPIADFLTDYSGYWAKDYQCMEIPEVITPDIQKKIDEICSSPYYYDNAMARCIRGNKSI